MKKVFSNSEVCHVFASQTQNEGRTSNSNIFFKDDTIYSYGYHFPMATFSEGGQIVYFTTEGYSVSTSQHLSYLRQALNHFPMIMCNDPEEARSGNHTKNLNSFNGYAKESAHKLRNARKPEIYLNQIACERASFETYCEHFNIKQTKKLLKTLPYLFIESKDGGKVATEKEVRAIAKAKREREKRAIKQHTTELTEFRTFERQRMYSRNGQDYLRHNTETNEIETSQGITIDLKEAERVYKLVLACVKRGGCTDCGTVDGRYKINSISLDLLTVGCHSISMNEVLTVGKSIFG